MTSIERWQTPLRTFSVNSVKSLTMNTQNFNSVTWNTDIPNFPDGAVPVRLSILYTLYPNIFLNMIPLLNTSSVFPLPSSVLCHHHDHRWPVGYRNSYSLTVSPPRSLWRQDAQMGGYNFIFIVISEHVQTTLAISF